MSGDGKPRENTYFLWFGKNHRGSNCVKVSNFNNEYEKDTALGPDRYVALLPLNEHYFVVLTEEMCTFSRFFGLVDTKEFFSQENEKCWDGKVSIQLLENKSIED